MYGFDYVKLINSIPNSIYFYVSPQAKTCPNFYNNCLGIITIEWTIIIHERKIITHEESIITLVRKILTPV